MQFKLYRKSLNSSHFYQSWQAKLLNYELQFKEKSLLKLQDDLPALHSNIKCSFSPLDRTLLRLYASRFIENFVATTQRVHRDKLERLGVKSELRPCNPDDVVLNYSSVPIPSRIKTLLAFGLQFGLPVFKINYYDYFLAFETMVDRLGNYFVSDKDKLDEFIKQLHHLSHKYFYNFKPRKIFSSIFNRNDIKQLVSLSRNENIVICKPDKGKGVVIIDKTSYIDKMSEMIEDSSKFEEITDMPFSKYTWKIEDRLNNFLRKVKEKLSISGDTLKTLHASGCAPGILYGLPKVHKPDFATNFQFRPIFAAYNNPCYKLAKFLVPYLTPYASNEYSLSNSYTFVSQLSEFENTEKLFMASLDIESLYTNVPLTETINIILSQIFTASLTTFLGLSRDLFGKLLELSVRNSFFLFNGRLYNQVDGLGMGLPLSPTFANIFLCYHEERWLDECPLSFKPVYYRRYVDDTFVLFRNKSHVHPFLNYMNSKHHSIRFSVERENSNKLPFLDVLVERNGNQFHCSVYRKPSFSGQGMSFFSFCDYRYKVNSIRTLINRAYNICSSYDLLHREFEFLKQFFINNGFPTKVFYSKLQQFLSSKFAPLVKTANTSENIYFLLPYFGQLYT